MVNQQMGFSFTLFCLCGLMAIVPALCFYDDGFSRATYYGSPECKGNPTGACGFGEYGKNVNDGQVAGVARLYRNGTGCGACYQVRCKDPVHCNDDGTRVVVTDFGIGHYTDFILTVNAYVKLAKPNMADALLAYGVVDVEYKRVPCQYTGYNLLLRVHERSKYPHYLAIVTLYQAGIYDITAAEIWVDDCKEWRPMRKPYGAAWDMQNPPVGAVTIRFQVQAYGFGDPKWVQLAGVLPDKWEAGATYDTNIQFDKV